MVHSASMDQPAQLSRATSEAFGASASVTAENIMQSAIIRSTYNPIALANIGGDVQVDGSSNSVRAEKIARDVDISNIYKYVLLSGTRGSVKVYGSSPIDVVVDERPRNAEIEVLTKSLSSIRRNQMKKGCPPKHPSHPRSPR